MKHTIIIGVSAFFMLAGSIFGNVNNALDAPIASYSCEYSILTPFGPLPDKEWTL